MTRDSVPARDLARLLATERRLDERLHAAQTEAELLVTHAREDAERREAALAAELERDEQRLTERVTRDRRKREQEIADAATRQIAAYRDVSPERLALLARQLGNRLLDDETAP
jgi:vacuolar-type H+-ATPase subunit H